MCHFVIALHGARFPVHSCIAQNVPADRHIRRPFCGAPGDWKGGPIIGLNHLVSTMWRAREVYDAFSSVS
jgi:hypothetical protein